MTIQLGPALQFAAPSYQNNLGAPVAIGGSLYVVDQQNGIGQWTGAGVDPVISAGDVPAGVTPDGREAFLNIAGDGNTAYVAFTSSTLPTGLTAVQLPDNSIYASAAPRYQILYRYDRDNSGNLSTPTPLAAFETATNGHTGGGLLALPGGKVAFARGDNLSQHFNGDAGPQTESSKVGQLLIIDGTTGAVETAALGLRNVQRLTYADAGKTQIAIADVGWTVAEEINLISVADLADTGTVENFGWGRNADGKVREGTFYVSDGPESAAEALGEAPTPEAGFVQPHAQFDGTGTGYFAVTGPVASGLFLSGIELLFGDLVSGSLFATLPGADETLASVFEVAIQNQYGDPTSLLELTQFNRADLRLFSFADGQPGLLLEREGTAYALSQVIAAVPAPGAGLLLVSVLGAVALRRRPRKPCMTSSC